MRSLGGGFTFGGGNLFVPLSYLFGDILTEVYGYAKSRRVVWAGFAALIFATTGLLLLKMHSGHRPGTWPMVGLGLVLPLLLALLFIH